MPDSCLDFFVTIFLHCILHPQGRCVVRETLEKKELIKKFRNLFNSCSISTRSTTLLELLKVFFEMKTTLTEREISLISELRTLVADLLEDEYEEKDEYLITWLKYANFDLKKAESALRNNKKWRKDNNMDNILLEDMKEMQENYPVELSGVDKDGCPIMAIQLDGDLRKIIDTSPEGKCRYVRYMMKNCEGTIQQIRQQHFVSGGEVNHFSAVVDMDGFCFRQLMSRKVISALTEVAKSAEDNYPGVTKSLYVINAPKTLKMLLNIVKPFLSADTISRLKMFDSNKPKWKEALLLDIPEDQFPSFLRNSLAKN